MESAALVAEARSAGAQLPEIPGRPGDNVVVEVEVDAALLHCWGELANAPQKKPVRPLNVELKGWFPGRMICFRQYTTGLPKGAVKSRIKATQQTHKPIVDIEAKGFKIRTLAHAGCLVVLIENRALPFNVEKAGICELRSGVEQRRPTYTLDMSADVAEKALTEIRTVDGIDGERAEMN